VTERAAVQRTCLPPHAWRQTGISFRYESTRNSISATHLGAIKEFNIVIGSKRLKSIALRRDYKHH